MNVVSRLASGRRRLGSVLALAMLAGCNEPDVDQGRGQLYAVVRGAVTRSDGMPLSGATVVVRVQIPVPSEPCRPLSNEGFGGSTTTDSNGRFALDAIGGEFREYLACVSVHIRPPIGAALADTTQHLLRVMMKSRFRPELFDTLTVGTIMLRASP